MSLRARPGSARTASTSSTQMANCPTPFCARPSTSRPRGLVSRILPQRDVQVLEAEHRQVLLLVQRKQAEDLPVEPLRALKVPDYQSHGIDLLLPFSHVAPLLHRWCRSEGWTARRPVTHRPSLDEMADGRVPFSVTAANTAAMTADNACHGWTAPGKSAQPTDHYGWSWTACPLLRIKWPGLGADAKMPPPGRSGSGMIAMRYAKPLVGGGSGGA